MSMPETELRIGEVAERAGVSISAIRFYEREGLLPRPERVGGQRRFPPEVVERLRIIDVAKQAGFTLEEVRTLLTSTDEGAPAHEQLQALATHKLPEVEALIARAESMRNWLTAAGGCGCESLESCGLFINATEPLNQLAEDRFG
jgi:MerR family transcriptional regulator, redox-sensitive transcriptional activator SoxR